MPSCLRHARTAPPGAAPTAAPRPRAAQGAPHILELEDLTVLTAWAEAAVEAVSFAPERTAEVLSDCHPGAHWRAAMGLSEPSARLGAAIESMARAFGAVDVSDGDLASDALLAAAVEEPA